MNYKETIVEVIDRTEIQQTLIEKPAEQEKSNSIFSYRGYTKDYVQGLEKEITRLVQQNFYLQSDQHINNVLAKESVIRELEKKINLLQKQNDDLLKEKEVKTRKIYLISLLVRKLSFESVGVDREEALKTLKTILEE
jgi:hypothetical protein